jgi:hypothetical protein
MIEDRKSIQMKIACCALISHSREDGNPGRLKPRLRAGDTLLTVRTVATLLSAPVYEPERRMQWQNDSPTFY